MVAATREACDGGGNETAVASPHANRVMQWVPCCWMLIARVLARPSESRELCTWHGRQSPRKARTGGRAWATLGAAWLGAPERPPGLCGLPGAWRGAGGRGWELRLSESVYRLWTSDRTMSMSLFIHHSETSGLVTGLGARVGTPNVPQPPTCKTTIMHAPDARAAALGPVCFRATAHTSWCICSDGHPSGLSPYERPPSTP